MHNPWCSSRGSITLVALLLAAAMGISLASYLALCRQSLLLSTRNQQITQARRLAEGGLELALWKLNQNFPTPPATGTTSMGNGVTGTVTTMVTYPANPALDTPTITATATVSVAGLGNFTKILTATTKPAPLFANAISVLNCGVPPYLSIPAGTIIDSWNSDPDQDYNVTAGTPAVAYSFTPGTTSNYAAIIAAPSIRLDGNTTNGGVTINGYAATFGDLINYTILDQIKGPATPALTPIDTARVSKSAYVPNFTVQAPAGPSISWIDLPANAAWGASQTIGTANGPTEYYKSKTNEPTMVIEPNNNGEDLVLNGSQFLYVNGPAVIVVNENFEMRDNSKIIITTNGRLEIYVRNNVVIQNMAGFENLTKEPKNLALFCTSEYSNNFSFTYSTNTTDPFYGVLYSADPNQQMYFTVSPNFYGAIWAAFTPRLSGPILRIHYDTALQYLPKNWFKGVTTPFIIVQLTES